MSRTLRHVVILVAAVGVAVALLWATTLLPGAPLRTNIAKSAPTLTAETNHPGRFWAFNTFVGDNFTDALMLNISYRDPNATFADTFAARYYGGVLDNPVASLQERVDGGLDGQVEPDAIYERYWHGYLVFTRPALTVMTYPQVRVLNAVLLSGLLLVALTLMRRRLGWGGPVALIVALLLVAAPLVPLNLQFVGVFYIALAGIVAALLLRERFVRGDVARVREDSARERVGAPSDDERAIDRFDLELFLVLGILTSFIDYLTVPIVTLGLPLLTLMATQVVRGPRALVRRAWRCSVSWAAGYALFWAAKWAIIDVFMPDLDGMPVGSNVFNRLGDSYGLVDRIMAVAKNIANIIPGTRPVDAPLGVVADQAFMVYAAAWVLGAVVAVTCAWLVLNHLSRRRGAAAPIDWCATPETHGARSSTRSGSLILLAMADLPLLWYFVVADHSSVHNYFTFRGLAVLIFAVGLFFAYSIDWSALRDASPAGTKERSRV